LPTYELKSELAQFSLSGPAEDFNRKLTWVNSICALVLLIGLFGDRSGWIKIKALPPLEESVPVMVEPLPPPPQPPAQAQSHDQTDQEKPDTPQVVVVTLPTPAISFSVPTIGNLIAPAALAKAPPLNPLQPAAALTRQPLTLNNTGSSGERPQPPYPKIALDLGQQGTVTLLITTDEAGIITAIEVKSSSGFPMLDRSALDYVKRHWLLPAGADKRLFETSIIYRLAPQL
jgi:protein TonB